MQRYISLDVCDYTGNTLCNLYDSLNDLDGQATNVIVHTERNGFKELSFSLPSACDGEKNYRLGFLIADYRIRLRSAIRTIINGQIVLEDVEIDWFLISESKVMHEAFSTNYEIHASHISKLLNTKNLNLEFSDEEGNNVGTIREIAETILEGTGWHLNYVATFYEEDKFSRGELVEKVRSFSASAKTGAFKMMSDLCEMFDAKPIYHGEGTYIEGGLIKTGRTVDIYPMNPFSEKLEEGAVPPDLDRSKIIELYYDKNIKNISRTLNTDALVTVFYAYGSYGDRNGMASLQMAEHAEITFTNLSAGEYCFEYQQKRYYFTLTSSITEQKWSSLDYQSRSYLYDGTTLIDVYTTPKTTTYTVIPITESMVEYKKNSVPYIMDFSYFDKIGLLTPEMKIRIADAQQVLPEMHLAVEEASLAVSEAKAELSKTASSGSGFLMLDILSSDVNQYGYVELTLNKLYHRDGVIFRSDYDESSRNYFSWNTATGIKDSGEAIAGKGAVVYIVHEGNPTKWEKSYVKALGNGTDNYYRDSLGNIYELHEEDSYENYEDFPTPGQENVIYIATKTNKLYCYVNQGYTEIQASGYFYGTNEFEEPDTITLWTTEDTWHTGDKVYLFSADSIAGVFGPREDSITSNRKAIEEATKVSTETHPLYFISNNESLVGVEACLNSYGWCYRSYISQFNFGKLYFCWGADGDLDWHEVYIYYGDDDPEKMQNPSKFYCYSIKRMLLYRKENGVYAPINRTINEEKITTSFSAVIDGCINQEVLTKGMSERYNCTENKSLSAGKNYALKNEFNNYWLFTTDRDIANATIVHYIPSTKILWQDNDEHHVLKAVEHSFRSLDFPSANELWDATFLDGSYSDQQFGPTGDQYISGNIYVYDNVSYEFSLNTEIHTQHENAVVVCLSKNQRILGEFTSSPFITPNHTTHVRIVYNVRPTANNGDYFRVKDYDSVFFTNNKQYFILNCSGAGERLGINYLMDKFIALAHDTFEVKVPALYQAQQNVIDINTYLSESLGDMYREGYWQENDYVEGDEDKLYIDALDNLKEISHPQADYEISFLDLYGSEKITEDEIDTDYPDLDITYAAHLVDTDIDTNRWAYIDTIDKCYDKPWETKIEINTRLSMIGQQTFADVLAKIAEIASRTKSRQAIYEKASVITQSGLIAAENLEGAILANKIYLLGGTSNWYTDNKGNIVFEAADGNSAMMLTGRGLMIANSKDKYGDWDFRTAMSGQGINADAITTGEFSAKHILAGSITTDRLSASVGAELEISSNNALLLFATTDGVRPAGSLTTTDALIDIRAGDGSLPAKIDVLSGGVINLKAGVEGRRGGVLNIESYGQLNLAGGVMNLSSAGKINIEAGTTLEIKANSNFVVDSQNFKITKNIVTNNYDVEILGKVTAISGKIAGYNIGTKNPGTASEEHYLYAGQVQNMSANNDGIYLGTDGINLGGKFKVTKAGVLTATAGTIGDFTINSSIYSSTKSTINTNVAGVYIGADGIGLGKYVNVGTTEEPEYKSRFQVNSDGTLYARYATIVGSITASSGRIGNWHIASNSLCNNETLASSTVGMRPSTTDTDVIFWAGNTSRGSANFRVYVNGNFTATSADIKGAIKATSLYIGATDSSNGTQLKVDGDFVVKSSVSDVSSAIKSTAGIKVDSSGVVIGASSTASTAVRSAAGIKVDSTGVVISASATAATAVKNAAGIKVDSTGVVISSSSTASTAVRNAAGIKVDSSGVVISSSATASSAVRSAAGIKVNATTGVVISAANGDQSAAEATLSKIEALVLSGSKISPESLTSEAQGAITKAAGISVSNGRINLSSLSTSVATIDMIPDKISLLTFDTIGNGTGVVITPTGLTVGSSGSVDFSAAQRISFGIGTIPKTSISGGMNYYETQSGIQITNEGITLTGAKAIDMNINAHNSIHIGSDGLKIKGSRISVIDAETGELNGIWGRDDLIVLSQASSAPAWRKSVDAIEAHQAQEEKVDWILFKPMYDAQINYVGNSGISTDETIRCNKMTQLEVARAFSNSAPSYTYTFTFTVVNYDSVYRQLTFDVYLSNSAFSYNPTSSQDRRQVIEPQAQIVFPEKTNVNIPANGGEVTLTFTITNTTGINLCDEGTTIYYYIFGANWDTLYVKDVHLKAETQATLSRVPCTTYYYPPAWLN